MKTLILSSMMLLLAASSSYAQDDVQTSTRTQTTDSDSVYDQGETNTSSTTTTSTTTSETAKDEKDDEASSVVSVAALASDAYEEFDRDNKSMNYGGALLVESNFNDVIGIETGLMLVKRQYKASAGGAEFVAEVNRLHIPIVARLWATDFFSIAAGPYAAFNVGDVKYKASVGSVSATRETSADDNSEFGLDLAATLNMAVNDKSGIFVEGRYSQPFKEESDEDTEKMMALAGFKIDI